MGSSRLYNLNEYYGPLCDPEIGNNPAGMNKLMVKESGENTLRGPGGGGSVTPPRVFHYSGDVFCGQSSYCSSGAPVLACQ